LGRVPLCAHATANTKNSQKKVFFSADFRAKLLIFRNIFSLLPLQSSGQVCDREFIAPFSIDVQFLCFYFNGDVQSLLHCLFCVRFGIFIEVI